jgi:signal transduction histidine kinase
MQERVQLLGGSLKLESKPGKGTKIFVEAPV